MTSVPVPPIPPSTGASAEISTGELLARIKRAHDWAQLESAKNYDLVAEHVDEGGMLQALALQSRAAAFEAVRVVLEEILAPGTHTATMPDP